MFYKRESIRRIEEKVTEAKKIATSYIEDELQRILKENYDLEFFAKNGKYYFLTEDDNKIPLEEVDEDLYDFILEVEHIFSFPLSIRRKRIGV